jgi:trigger factor
MVAAQYGYQIETEVLNDKVGRAFNDAANEANCALLATQHRTEEGSPEGVLTSTPPSKSTRKS